MTKNTNSRRIWAKKERKKCYSTILLLHEISSHPWTQNSAHSNI